MAGLGGSKSGTEAPFTIQRSGAIGARQWLVTVLLAAAGLMALAALFAHAWINARAAGDFRALGIPPFQYHWQAGLLRVSAVPEGTSDQSGPAPGDQIAQIAG